MSMTQKNMSSVRMVAQERLDLPDFNALQSMVDNAMQLQLGALMGRGGGLLGPVNITTSTDGVNRFIEFTPFQYYWSQREPELASPAQSVPYRGWRGGISQYNPTAPGQVTKVVYNDALATGVASIVWARPTVVSTDTDARRKFSAGAEQSISTQTRNTVVTQFKITVATTDPDSSANDGWAPIFYIGGWNANLPISTSPISVWDSWSAYKHNGFTGTFATDNSVGTGVVLSQLAVGDGSITTTVPAFVSNATSDADLGLLEMLTLLRMRHRRHLDPAGTMTWAQDPNRGLKALDTDLLAAETDIALLQAYREASPIPWAGGGIVWNAGLGTYSAAPVGALYGTPLRVVTVISGAGLDNGFVVVECDPPPVGYHYCHVAANIGYNVSPLGIRAYPSNAAPNLNKMFFQVFNTTTGAGVGGTFYFTAFISKD